MLFLLFDRTNVRQQYNLLESINAYILPGSIIRHNYPYFGIDKLNLEIL